MRPRLPSPCRAALRRIRLCCMGLCCMGLLCACAAPTVRKQVLAPAEATEVARLTRLSVQAFDNDPGGQVRAAVEGALAQVVVDGRPYFAVIGTNWGTNGGAGAPAAPQGRPLQWIDRKSGAQPVRYGSEGLVRGGVGQNGWNDERHFESRRECLAEDDKGRCRLWGNRRVRCVRRVARFSFTPTVVDKDTGAVLLAQEFAESGLSEACEDRGAPEGGGQLLAAARARAVARFRDHVAPHVVTLKIPLLTEDASGMSSQVKTLVSGGVDFATAGQTGKACTLWRKAAGLHARGPALPYLLGVCAELEDDLDRAGDFYAQAQQRSSTPLPEIAAALGRVQAARADRERLERQRK